MQINFKSDDFIVAIPIAKSEVTDFVL